MSNHGQVSSIGRQFSLPVIGAIVIHVACALLLVGSWSFSSTKPSKFELPKHIEAKVVTIEKPKPVAKPVSQPKPKPKPKPVVKPKPKPKPVVKPKPVTTPKPVEPEVAEVNTNTTQAPTVSEKPEPVKEPEIEEIDPETLFEDLLAGVKAEEQDINNKIEDIAAAKVHQAEIQGQVANYQQQIQLQIEQKWSRPVELRLMDLAGIEAVVAVELLPTGELVAVQISKASGNENFDQSVLRAVEKVRRFSVPKEPEVFEAGGFRRLNITFRPEDLMKL